MIYRKLISISIIPIILTAIFSSSAFSIERNKTVVTVVEGKVLCFDIPEELIPAVETGEIIIGTFLERRNEYLGKVEAFSKKITAYIPYNYRYG